MIKEKKIFSKDISNEDKIRHLSSEEDINIKI